MNATIRIAGHLFEVIRETPSKGLGHENMGCIDYKRETITIDASQKEPRQKKVLLHELIHASDYLFGSNEMTEEQVVAIENGLWAIFNDNPGLARGLFGDAA